MFTGLLFWILIWCQFFFMKNQTATNQPTVEGDQLTRLACDRKQSQWEVPRAIPISRLVRKKWVKKILWRKVLEVQFLLAKTSANPRYSSLKDARLRILNCRSVNFAHSLSFFLSLNYSYTTNPLKIDVLLPHVKHPQGGMSPRGRPQKIGIWVSFEIWLEEM